jgi:hypothetical protein
MRNLTPQAKSIFVAGSIASLAAVFIISDKKVGLVVGGVIFGFTCYNTHVTNCSVVGKCGSLAWFIVITNVLMYIAAINRLRGRRL